MKKLFKVIGVTGLMAGMLIVGGCGSSGDTTQYTVPVKNISAVDNGATAQAGTTDFAYLLAPGNYTYSICQFGKGDQLVFPAGTGISTDNSNFGDGAAKLESTSTAGTVTVELTCLTPAQDAAIFTVNDVNTLFGAGTVTQK